MSSQQPQGYATINEICEEHGISRTTFYRMLDRHRDLREDVCVRIPPGRGRLRIHRQRFEAWLRKPRRVGRRF